MEFIASVLARTVSNAVPLALAGVGGIFAERSGVVSVGVEGYMLAGAFSAAVGCHYTGSPWLGLLIGIAFAMLSALVHGFLCITVQLNHVVSGLAINIFMGNLSIYLSSALFGSKGNTPEVTTLPSFSVPILRDLPLVGELFGNISVITLLSVVVVAAAAFLLYRTPFGLHVLAAGEKPAAAASLGIDVKRVRYLAVLIGGFTAGMAGAFLSISYLNMFTKNMVAGRGFIAIATIIFGKYRPGLVALAGLLFGFLSAMQVALQGTIAIPQELTQSIPYVVTIVVVALTAQRSKEM